MAATLECDDCGWTGTVDKMANTDGPSDLSPGQARPVGACPDCDWWFGRADLVAAGKAEADAGLRTALETVRRFMDEPSSSSGIALDAVRMVVLDALAKTGGS